MKISQQIDEAMALVTAKTGHEIWCIYLGRSQATEMTREGFAMHVPGSDRAEYRGALIFVVDDNDHLNVS